MMSNPPDWACYLTRIPPGCHQHRKSWYRFREQEHRGCDKWLNVWDVFFYVGRGKVAHRRNYYMGVRHDPEATFGEQRKAEPVGTDWVGSQGQTEVTIHKNEIRVNGVKVMDDSRTGRLTKHVPKEVW